MSDAARVAQEVLQGKTYKGCTFIGSKSQNNLYPGDDEIVAGYGSAVLTNDDVGAYTLEKPTEGEEGTQLTIISNSAKAHVVTCTGGINDGVTGGAKDTLTFAAFEGASVQLQAVLGAWAVLSLNKVTVS